MGAFTPGGTLTPIDGTYDLIKEKNLQKSNKLFSTIVIVMHVVHENHHFWTNNDFVSIRK
jgi:hypothetical protein